MRRPFHLAFPVSNLADTRHFYGAVLGCREGRSAPKWIDFDFFGHQISAHLKPEACAEALTNAVDGDGVPVRHFGCILELDAWRVLRDRVATHGIEFMIGPRVRFEGTAGEQATFFIKDPAGNGLEFKAFADDAMIFATD